MPLRARALRRLVVVMIACSAAVSPSPGYSEASTRPRDSFGSQLDFFKKYISIIILQDATGEVRLAISPAWLGRLMSSTAQELSERGFGCINRKHIAPQRILAHMNIFGGEERFWIGPKGGQFSIFHTKGRGCT